MENIFAGLDYVKKYVLSEDTNSVHWYDILTGTANNVVVVSHKNFDPYVRLISDEYTLKYDGRELNLSSLIADESLDNIDDPNITEEWFFQLSTIKDFGALEYIEIEFVKEVYKRCFNTN